MTKRDLHITIPYETVRGHPIGNIPAGEDAFTVTGVTVDSRTLSPGGLFVALLGTRLDGHAYIGAALEAGAGAVLMNEAEYEKYPALYDALILHYQDARLVVVPDTLRALQDAARYYLAGFPDLIRIGITGSYGKTTTKEILFSILSRAYSAVCNQGNLNSDTGLPLSVFTVESGHTVGIFELGMNRAGEIAETASVLSPNYALITNVGSAHIGFFGSRKAIAAEKKALFSALVPGGVAVVPGEAEFTDFLSEGVDARIVPYGDPAAAGVTDVVDKGLDGATFNYEGKAVHFPLPGRFNLKNALAAITLARELGVDGDSIRNGLRAVRPLFGRTETLVGTITVIQDCYNASPDTMASALTFFQGLDSAGKKVLVLGDMLELGDESEDAHRKTLVQALTLGASLVILMGERMARAADNLGLSGEKGSGGFRNQSVNARYLKPATPFENADTRLVDLYVFDGIADRDIAQAADVLNTFLQKGDLLLLKASRGIAMERISERLQGLLDCAVHHEGHGGRL